MEAQRDRLLRIRENRNLARVYAEIRHYGPLPKSKIGLDLPVSKPTRYGLMSALLTDGLLIEDPDTNATRSSRSTFLDIRADLFHTIGIDVHLAGIDFLIMDLKRRQRDALFVPNRIDDAHNQSLDDRQVVVTRIQDGLRQIMDRNGLDGNDILAVGISDFGMVDAKNGISVRTPHIPGWVDVPLRSIVQRLLSVPVYMGRDANLMTVAEIKSEGLADLDDALCLSLRRGVGLGIYLNGELYTGQSGNAGELSHTRVKGNDAPCVCGKRGCLDTLIGHSAIMERARAERESNAAFRTLFPDPDDLVLERLFQHYNEGAPAAVSFLQFFVDTLALEIADLCYIFDPNLIILSGRLASCGERLLADLQMTVRRHLAQPLYQGVRLVRGKLGPQAAVWGAAYMAQEMLLSPDPDWIARKQEQRTLESMLADRIG